LLPVIGNALYDNAVMVRAHAAGALGAFGMEREDALALCAVALKDAEWMVRVGGLESVAALALSEAGERGEMEKVKESLRDGHPEVRRRARAILVKAGVPVPEGVEEDEVRSVARYDFE
jgi:HEAT repeat protein